MAGAINLTEVDFDQIKQNLIDYLKSTGQFSDYNFDGSNLQVILNLIAYQSQLNAYSTNMVANESFLSSATLRENVVANARTIGYVPVSAKAAFSDITFTYQLQATNFPSGFPKTLVLEPGMAFSTNAGSENLTFNVIDTQIGAVTSSGRAIFEDIRVYEGTYLTKKFTKDASEYNQKFIIDNTNVDSSTIRVEVQENPNDLTTVSYSLSTNLVEIGPESKVFWLEEVNDGRYELTFGDGLFGKSISNGSVINVTYLVTNGSVGNGITGTPNMTFIGKTTDESGSVITERPTVTSLTQTTGGAEIEDIASIKFRAPRERSAQNRCVVAEDYETIVRRIYPSAEDIYVFGGDELEIPQYGRVYIVIKPIDGSGLTTQAKSFIKKSLDEFRVGSLDIVILDAEILNIEIISTIHYDNKKTLKDTTTISASVKDTLKRYAESDTVSKFGGAVRFSKVVAAIDDSDDSITRNNTSMRMRRDMEILKNTAASYEVCFENQIEKVAGGTCIYSTGFQVLNDTKTYYFEDDGEGNLRRFYLGADNAKVIVDASFGTVDYTKGEVKLAYGTPVTIVNTTVANDVVEIRAIPLNQDIIVKNSVYINLDVAKSDIVSLVDTEITGS